MVSYMCNAKYVFDVNTENDTVEIEYTKHIPGIGWKIHTDYIDTYPEGDWTELTFDDSTTVKYVDFLNTMVFKSLDVSRKIAKVSLDNFSGKSKRKLLKVMNAIRILDPTFTPPEINTDCSWQNELLDHICHSVSYRIIATCTNKYRLDRYSKVVQLI